MKISNSPHTFVILAYRVSPHLRDCIESLLNQTVKSRIIISTSTPSTYLTEISKRFDIPVHINPNRSNIASDWSFAYSLCRSPYLTLAHQDDVYLSEYTQQCMKAIGKNPSGLLAFTDYIESVGSRIRSRNLLLTVKRCMLAFFFNFQSHLSSIQGKKWVLALGNPICCPSIFYNKARIGTFRFDENFTMNLDWEATLRLASRHGDFIYVKKRLLIRRIHHESESTLAIASRRRQREDYRMFEQFWPPAMLKILLRLYAIGYKSNG